MAPSRIRDVSLSAELEAFAHARLASGQFGSASDLVSAALRPAPPAAGASEAVPHQDLLRDMAEESPAMLWVADRHGRAVLLNRALRDFCGVPGGDAGALDWNRLLHPEDAAAVAATFAAGLRDGVPFVAEGRYRHAAGGYRTLRTEARPRFGADDRLLGLFCVAADVTEMRQAEARRRLAKEAGGIGTFEWDLRSGRVEWSPEMFRLHDMDPATPPEVLMQAWLARIHPEDRDRVAQDLRDLRAGNRPLQGEFRILLADGETRWIMARGVLVRDEAGQAPRISGVGMDISGLRRAEAKARESEAQQRAMFDAAPFGVIVIDPGTHAVLDVNQRACEDLGYSRDEFLRLVIGDIDTAADAETIRARGRQGRLHCGAQEFEAQHRTRNGSLRDVLVRVVGLEIGGRNVSYGAHLDITDRKRDAAALRASEARLRLALEAAGFGTWEYDIRRDRGARKGVFANDFPGVPATGFSLETWLSPVHPEDRPLVEARLREVLEGRAAGYVAEFRVPRLEGGWRWMASRGAVVETDEQGQPLTLAGISRDITESRQVAERQALLAREVDHRAKNVLAVVQAALRLTRAADLPSYIRAIEGRVAALARTQTLLAENQWDGARLDALLRGEIAAFADDGRVALEGPAVALRPALAQALAMAIHELATNAVKHGALSTLAGRVRVAWQVAGGPPGRLHLSWCEVDGPPLPGPPARRGFGSRVLEATLCRQLGGTVDVDWQPGGLVCRIEVPLAQRGG
ncbi:PAS domain-containing protein [Falsiroseomonas sp.]|uniref:PAS domain-containing protein n=1 Tax=Falsiroseomonas sp. TaxID=2870721 RepID=UPI002734B08E|nr:PAS domain-containing protein [Falsiroseomonas sp.]MDP3414392.1 PAS domain-containing protein [Falsiroseomonas sp.]